MAFSVTLSKTTVDPGESIRVDWSLTNGFMSSYYFKIDFELNGSLVRTENLGRVGSGETESSSFTFNAPKTPGTYKFEAIVYMRPSVYADWLDYDSVTKQITVESEVPPVPPIARIQGIKVNGESIRNGESKTIDKADVTVSVRVSNVGSKGTIVAHIDIKDSKGNGVYSTTKTVSMYAGETKEITFSTTLPKADTYKVTVSVGH